MKYKSASMQIVEFLRAKPIGFEFTADQLMEDINTTPGEEPIKSAGALNGCLVKQRKHGGLSAVAIRGKHKRPAYMYTLIAHNKLYAMNRGSIGSKPGRKFAGYGRHDFHLEGKPPAPDLFNKPEPTPDGSSANAPAVNVSDEVRYHIRCAFRAYKRNLLAGQVLLRDASTHDLMAELQRRIDHAKDERKAKANQEDGTRRHQTSS